MATRRIFIRVIEDNVTVVAAILLVAIVFLGLMIFVHIEDSKKQDLIQECVKSGKDPHDCLCAFDPNKSICQSKCNN